MNTCMARTYHRSFLSAKLTSCSHFPDCYLLPLLLLINFICIAIHGHECCHWVTGVNKAADA